ncbi:hypothetical protein [Serratia rubidaea]|nr:hypothetical protein [Serratia rubidaea]
MPTEQKTHKRAILGYLLGGKGVFFLLFSNKPGKARKKKGAVARSSL